MKEVTVLIADDQRLVREGIASLLNIQDGIKVVGLAVDGREAVRRADGEHEGGVRLAGRQAVPQPHPPAPPRPRIGRTTR